MPRKLQPAFVTTFGVAVGSLLGCAGVADQFQPPEPTRNPPPMPQPTVTFPKPPFSSGQSLEGRDEQGRVIYSSGEDCWVELPYTEAPTSWQPPPRQQVVCPEPLRADPAFANCPGSLHLTSLDPTPSCICYISGNPPPSPQASPCPTIAIPELASATPAIPEVPLSKNPPHAPRP